MEGLVNSFRKETSKSGESIRHFKKNWLEVVASLDDVFKTETLFSFILRSSRPQIYCRFLEDNFERSKMMSQEGGGEMTILEVRWEIHFQDFVCVVFLKSDEERRRERDLNVRWAVGNEMRFFSSLRMKRETFYNFHYFATIHQFYYHSHSGFMDLFVMKHTESKIFEADERN